MMTKTTSIDVLASIFERHSGPEWVCLSEVANGTGGNIRRRADAFCMNIWPSKGYATHGFEIKVSRSDFMHEMKDITKAEAVGQYCDFWWLATPSGLVSVDEVPASWGLLELCGNKMRVKKQAPMRENPSGPSRAFVASLIRSAVAPEKEAAARLVAAQVEASSASAEIRLRSEYDRKMEGANRELARTKEWIASFEAATGQKFNQWSPAKDVAAKLEVAKSINLDSLIRTKNALDQSVNALSIAIEAMAGKEA